MFSIFKRKKTHVDLSDLKTDMHSHLIPGIDDGSDNVTTSIYLIKGLMDLGYSRFIATPHVMWDMYRNDVSTIAAAHRTLQKGIAENQLEITTRAAAEYFIDDYFESLVQNDTSLLTIKDKLVLVEISFASAPLRFRDHLFQLLVKGYQPVLAHPERYLYFAADKKQYDELKDMGCLFQLNLLSLAGYYGRTCQELAHYLVKKNYIDLLGTDLHHHRHLEALRNSPVLMDSVKTLLDTGKIQNPAL
jgi:protein-tyrosine phosphatase